MSERYIWSTDQTQKIRVREIREYKITFDSTAEAYFVSAHGYGFGKGVTIFGPKPFDECTKFVDGMTTEKPKSECGAAYLENKGGKL